MVEPLELIEKSVKESTVLLIDDQQMCEVAFKRIFEGQEDIHFHYCKDPSLAFQFVDRVKPTVILLDLVMPEIDGLTLAAYIRANPLTKDIPLIILSVNEDPKIKEKAFQAGASDYAVKLPDKVELLARIRYHSQNYIRFLERNLAFQKLREARNEQQLQLEDAAEYVKEKLPQFLQGSIKTVWEFIPCESLGGDAFSYHFLDENHFAFFLLDVCGHGVGAALLSATLLNVIGAKTLPKTDFFNPKNVLERLNDAFPMESHRNMFFSIWYGVYDLKNRILTYSSGGHPAALLFQPGKEVLKTDGLVIGAIENQEYVNAQVKIEPHARLYLFSDGVFEYRKINNEMHTYREFIDSLEQIRRKSLIEDLIEIRKRAINLSIGPVLSDDYSIVIFDFD